MLVVKGAGLMALEASVVSGEFMLFFQCALRDMAVRVVEGVNLVQVVLSFAVQHAALGHPDRRMIQS